eukprot:COSAG05_NODE_1919_length_3833_cov_3.495179_3_plen_85_part_00
MRELKPGENCEMRKYADYGGNGHWVEMQSFNPRVLNYRGEIRIGTDSRNCDDRAAKVFRAAHPRTKKLPREEIERSERLKRERE